ncbi:hypothetical protein T05_6924 [Trichinella murrelli]|uniref:Uncharacterized protein n=1 Tax=Trichinella murrelli TaxID=144512 RepID=A0A0V0U6T6_9BILA|nr:hypothetical protein T05_6924 [Trichinella murrelli]
MLVCLHQVVVDSSKPLLFGHYLLIKRSFSSPLENLRSQMETSKEMLVHAWMFGLKYAKEKILFADQVDQSRLFSAFRFHFGTFQIKSQHNDNQCGEDQSGKRRPESGFAQCGRLEQRARLVGDGVELCKCGDQDRGLNQQGAAKQRRSTECGEQQRPGAGD